jgi:hypothetical protein
MNISIVETQQRDLRNVRLLLRHCNAFLGEFGFNRCFQDCNLELESLPGAYVKPRGNLWVARDAALTHALRRIAVKAVDYATCEMKRL